MWDLLDDTSKIIGGIKDMFATIDGRELDSIAFLWKPGLKGYAKHRAASHAEL